MPRRTVAICMLGPALDRAGKKRQDPCQHILTLLSHADLPVDQLELICQKKLKKVAKQLIAKAKQISPKTKIRLHSLEFDNAWNFEEVYRTLLDFANDYRFEPDQEEYLVHTTTDTQVIQICLYLLTESRFLPGRLVLTSPPSKREPEGTYTIIDLSNYDTPASRFTTRTSDDLSCLKSGIETRNTQFNSLIAQVAKVSILSKAPILLTGTTGVGKSRMARRIFELKKRRRQVDGDLIELNCASLRKQDVMSTLFGHARGAFTGAHVVRNGLLSTADRGMIFLDEVSALNRNEQAMLLRAIEQKRFLPVGSDSETSSDFQLILATNRDLRTEVKKGTFREDLLAQIDLWTVNLPELRERPEDIEPNVDFEISRAESLLGHRVVFNASARTKFLSFAVDAPWLRNFRDLRASIERMATLAGGDPVSEQIVDVEVMRLTSAWKQGLNDEVTISLIHQVLGERADEVDLFDRAQLEQVLRVCRESSSMAEAGRKLFSVSRTKRTSTNDSDRIRKYLARYDLVWRDHALPEFQENATRSSK